MINSVWLTTTFLACNLVSTIACAQQPTSQELADRALADQDWPVALERYSALLQRKSTNADNWFGLARAQHQLGQHQTAIESYQEAIRYQYPQLALAHFHLARALMVTGEAQPALLELEKIAAAGGINFRLIQNTPEFETLADQTRFRAVIEALKPCNDENYRAFDFWLGEWDVKAANASSATAINVISVAHDGCAVLEQYQAGNFTGRSINFYDAARDTWHQTWIANNGSPLYLEGGPEGVGTMVLSDQGVPGATQGTVNQITWTLLADGRVRQHWQRSTDEQTWTTVFDGYYSKRDPTID